MDKDVCRQPRLTFTHGVLVGQGSLIVLVALFLRYFVFSVGSNEAAARRQLASLRRKQQRRHHRAQSAFSTFEGVPPPDTAILEKLGYDLSHHAPEPADWLNVLIAQATAGYRAMVVNAGKEGGRGAKGFVEDAMNDVKAAEAAKNASMLIDLDHISIKDLDFGQDYPVVSNARVRPSEEPGCTRIELDVDYTDHVSISLDTQVLVNLPRPRFAMLPISLTLTLARFSATLTLEIPTTQTEDPPSVMCSLHPDFTLDLTSTSLIGSRAKLQDIPKIEQLITSRLRGAIVDRVVWPRKFGIRLPTIGRKTVVDDFVWIDEDESLEQAEDDLHDRSQGTSDSLLATTPGDIFAAASDALAADAPDFEVSHGEGSHVHHLGGAGRRQGERHSNQSTPRARQESSRSMMTQSSYQPTRKAPGKLTARDTNLADSVSESASDYRPRSSYGSTSAGLGRTSALDAGRQRGSIDAADILRQRQFAQAQQQAHNPFRARPPVSMSGGGGDRGMDFLPPGRLRGTL